MANNVQFEVDDTSSMISYLPRGDTLSTVNLTAGWNPYFEGTGFLTALGETGRGTSMHITSLDGASLSIRWHGTGIKLYGNATDATYTISVDSAPTSPDVATFIQSENLLASVDDLSDSDHILTLTAHTLSSQDQPRSFVVFDRAILTAPPPESAQSNSSQFSLHTLIDGSISFNGEWSFDNGLGDAFRESNNAGDIAHTSFNGTSFLLTGATSPRAGNFSVTLDNTQVQLSAKSSFTNSETLLYYASGLDPDVSHNFSISNDDGSQLILPVGGLRSFSTSGPRPVASAHADGPAGYPAGTIAALALAGVLIFVLIAWLLFYLFMYRPRMRQQRLTGHVTSSPKVIEEAVIDIRRRNDSPPPTDGRKENRHVSDFQRWKRGASGSGHLGTDLLFRNSMDDKDLTGPGNIHERSDIPRGQTQNKGKGKTRWFGRQDKSEGSSPSFTLDLPLPAVPPGGTVAGSTSRNPGSWSRGSRSPHSAFSYLTSLSTPSFSSRKSSVRRHAEKDFPTSTRPEMPKFHARTSSQKPLLHFLGRRSDHIDEENSQRPTSYQSMTPYNPQDDHESLRYSRDVSVIGTTAAIRGLSPRTSEIRSTSETFHALNNTANRYGRNRDEIRPVLEMRQSSPFQVDFDRSQKHRNRLPSGVGSAVGHNERSKRTSAASHVRFEEVETSTAGAAMTSDAESTEEITEERRAPPNFRLTPLTINREAVTASFIDFSNSPSDSTRSNQPSDSSSHYPDPAVRSKWSSTQTEPHSVDPSTSPSSSTSFPFPVSLPASPHHPEGHRPSPPPRLQNVTSDDPSTLLHQHPLDYVSPTESVPLSVSTSDLRFRHSESEEMRNPQAIPPHPPLPRPSDEETTRRASPR